MHLSSSWGNLIHIQIFGESHGGGIGVVLDGLPAGYPIDMDMVLLQMKRRAPGQDLTSTARKESDSPEVLSGMLDGRTTGAPMAALIRNKDTRSGDYKNLMKLPRPSHADYTGHVRYSGFNDVRGGGHFSGRLTAPLVLAGAVCRQILLCPGIHIGSHIRAIAGKEDTPLDPVTVDAVQLDELSQQFFALVDPKAEDAMRVEVEKARLDCDSVGGIIECAAVGLPAGIGSPMFDGMENRIASLVMGIPAVRGIEFGTGFAAASMRGSEHNDAFVPGDGQVRTLSNHHGGVIGGITSGMPLLFRTAFKPTASIAKPQQTIDLTSGKQATLVIKGRHDPCIVPRALPVVEGAAAIAILDAMMELGKIPPYEGGRNHDA